MLRWNKPALRRALLLGLLALAACTAGPNFTRPAAPQSQSYTSAPLTQFDASGASLQPDQAPPVAWWTLFGSAELNDTMQLALRGNRDLQAAQSTLAQAADAARASGAALYPQVDMDAGAGRQKLGAAALGGFVLPPYTYYSIGPSVSYALDYTGGARRAIEAQNAQVDYERYQLSATYLTLTGNVALAALHIASARAQIDSVQSVLVDDENNLKLVQAAFDAGSVSRVDILSAQSQLANDQTLLPPLLQQLSLARHQLSILVGRLPAQWMPPDFDLQALAAPQQLPITLPSELVHHRPDILAAEAQLHAATADLGVATAALYPSVTLTATAGLQSLTLQHLFDSSSTAGSLMANLVAPIYDHGARRDRQHAARDAMQTAYAHYQQAVLTSFGQVADVLEALDHDTQLQRTQQRAVDTAAGNLDLARQSYGAGNSGILQLLDAQRLSQQAQLGLVRARAQLYQDAMQLMLVTGGAAPSDYMTYMNGRRDAATGP